MYLQPLGIWRMFEIGFGLSTILFILQIASCMFIGGYHTYERVKVYEAVLEQRRLYLAGEKFSTKEFMKDMKDKLFEAKREEIPEFELNKLRWAFKSVFINVKEKA